MVYFCLNQLYHPNMDYPKISITEKIVLGAVLLIVITGFVLFYTNLPLFDTYVVEDGIVEWLTVAGLLGAAFVCISRFFSLLRKRNAWFLFVTILLGLLLFFAAGEEISWGQRILGLKTPEYFAKNNAQHETNLHNLVVNGVKINKLVFSILLIGALAIFLLLVPVVYKKVASIRRFLDKSAVPVARVYQIIAFLVLFAIVSLLKHEKNAELLECGAALIFYLIVRFPQNKEIFKSAPPSFNKL